MLSRAEAQGRFDVLVVGGGATGLGTALDAASRGFSTLLLERFDLAHATSSRSTKLVHGGVRYLRQGNLGLVRESLRERGRLLRNAPHLVWPQSFVVPAYRPFERAFLGIGLKLYDKLAGAESIAPSRILTSAATRELVPGVRTEKLRGGVVYHDAQFDDARLALVLAQTAADHGASILNYFEVRGLIKDGHGKVSGVDALDRETGRSHRFEAKVIVNATGVFADSIRRLDDQGVQSLIVPSQGAHVVVDASFLPGKAALLVPKTEDGRVMFAIPWRGKLLLGTTDTQVEQPLVEPVPLKEEVEMILRTAGRYLQHAPQQEDIQSMFAGLRPLVGRALRSSTTGRMSREHRVEVSESGLVTVVGGKWTTYRQMAEETTDSCIEVGGLARQPCGTQPMRLHGAPEQRDVDPDRWTPYGEEAAAVRALEASDPSLAVRLHPELEFTRAQVIHAVREELARTVEDTLARRLGLLYLDTRKAMEIAPEVAELMATCLGQDRSWEQEQVRQFCAVASAMAPFGESSTSCSRPERTTETIPGSESGVRP